MTWSHIIHLLKEVEGESRGEVAGEDEGVEEQPLRRRTLLRVLGQGDLHETAKREIKKDIWNSDLRFVELQSPKLD